MLEDEDDKVTEQEWPYPVQRIKIRQKISSQKVDEEDDGYITTSYHFGHEEQSAN